MMAQIRRDRQLWKTLCDYKEKSEIVGMMEFVRDLKIKGLRGIEWVIFSTDHARNPRIT